MKKALILLVLLLMVALPVSFVLGQEADPAPLADSPVDVSSDVVSTDEAPQDDAPATATPAGIDVVVPEPTVSEPPVVEPVEPAEPQLDDACLDCHMEKTPGIVDYWIKSSHYSAKVSCTACHGSDKKESHKGKARVDASVCGSCHKEAYAEHLDSKHSISTKTGKGCTRSLPKTPKRDAECILCHEEGSTAVKHNTQCAMFLAQSPEMQNLGCGACHRVEAGCDTCHTKHGTDTAYAGLAETCGVCHMGPDHAQYEMWQGSMHGVVFKTRGEPAGPTCKTCHMPGGSHNVSRGIATGQPGDVKEKERAAMLVICSSCHTGAYAKRSLAQADKIQNQSYAMLAEAQGIVKELYDEGLLDPAPGDRPGHPIFGSQFVIGPHMTYEDISSPEVKFFKMMMFYYMSAYKGAFHQSPDFAHWYGNAPLKMTLSELKSDAAMLKKLDAATKRIDNLVQSIEEMSVKPPKRDIGALKKALRELNEAYLSGGMDKAEYLKQKGLLLDEMGL